MDFLNQLFSATPSIAMMQMGLVAIAALLVFLVLFATRDVLLRAESFPYQLLCIVLVAALPLFGFLLYLLIRPSRTRAERKLAHDITLLLERLRPTQQHSHQQKKKHQSAQGFTMQQAGRK